MPRKLKHAFLENERKRKIAYRTSGKGLVKSTEKLSLQCRLDCCLIVNDAFGNEESIVWPSEPEEVNRVISKYADLPKAMKERHSSGQISFTKHLIDKVEKKGNILRAENREKELSCLISRCLKNGRESVDDYSMKDLVDMGEVIDAELLKVSTKLKKFLFYDSHPVEPTITTGEGKGKDQAVVIPTNEGKGKEVIKPLPFDLNVSVTDGDDDPGIAAGNWRVDPIQGDRGGAGTSDHT